MGSNTGQRQKQAISQAQRDINFFQERDAERAANAAKSARLRTLRLAKEADEKAAADLALSLKASQPKRKSAAKLN